MRALLVSTSLAGGAGGATARLHRALRDEGVDARVLVARGADAGDDTIIQHRPSRAGRIVRRRLERRPLARYPMDPGPGQFSIQWVPSSVHRSVAAIEPDVVNLHWVCGGFVSVKTVARIDRPIVWTLHDMWPFTGGCHFAGPCERYRDSCGACPELGSSDEADLSRRIWSRKQRAWRKVPMTIVSPSNWLAECARQSSLFADRHIEVVPYGIDLETFRPTDRLAARDRLRLPAERKLVLFGAWSDIPRKGRPRLIAALKDLAARGTTPVDVVAFGPPWTEQLPGIEVHSLGRLGDPRDIAQAYSAADVYVLPSLADNLPTTVIEALACGTPCVAFRTGGLPDLIDHERTGYLADAFSPSSLADGIQWVLADEPRRRELGERARAHAERTHDAAREARAYVELFHSARQP